jgi:chaperonin GroEL
MMLRQAIEQAAPIVDRALTALAVPAEGQATFERIATIAAADPELGRLLGEAMTWTGSEGTIGVIEGRTSETYAEYSEGYLFDRGYLSPHFVTNRERDEVVIDDPAILLTDQVIAAGSDLLPILEKLVAVGKRDLVVIARDVEPEPLALLAQNATRGVFRVLAVKAPEFDERRTAALDDLALVTGGVVLAAEGGQRLVDSSLDHLGRADQVISRRNRTTIIGGRGDPAAVAARVRQIKHELAKQSVKFHREKLEARLVRLGGRVVEIHVGGPTVVAIKERKARLDDAHHALRLAMTEGILPGGGVALLHAACRLRECDTLGSRLLANALSQPARQLVANAGAESAVVVAEIGRRQQESGNSWLGYDVRRHCFVDFRDAGIFDALPVTRAAVRHAVSIGAMLLTSEVLIAPIPINEAERRRKQRKPWPGLAMGH